MAITERYVSTTGAGTNDGTSEANAFTWAQMITDINLGTRAGFRYNVKANATYSRTTTADSITSAGTTTSPVVIRGYTSSIGDANLGRTNNNGPLITTNMPSVTYTTGSLTIAADLLIESINITSANVISTAGSLKCTSGSLVYNCAITNTANNSNSAALHLLGVTPVIDCDVSYTGGNSSACAVRFAGTGGLASCSRVTAPSATAVRLSSGTTIEISDSTVFGSVTGIDVSFNASASQSVRVLRNTIIGNTTGVLYLSGITSLNLVIGNLITDCTTGIDCGATAVWSLFARNRFDRNTTNIANSGDWQAATSYNQNTTSATQANEFTNYAGNDFSLRTSSPAVANGLPAYRDIGALQKAANNPVAGSLVIRNIGTY